MHRLEAYATGQENPVMTRFRWLYFFIAIASVGALFRLSGVEQFPTADVASVAKAAVEDDDAKKKDSAEAKSEPPRIGDQVADLRFKDIRYLTRSLKDFGPRKFHVLVFTNTTCPLVQRYWPKLKRLEAQYREQGVQFVNVNVGLDETVSDVAQQALDYGVEFPSVKDPSGKCSAAVGAARTPHVVVLDAERRLRYRGRVDDQVRLGGVRPELTRDDLKLALDDLLAGRSVEQPETPIEGCLITREATRTPQVGVTFHEHVTPILQRHCQECHRAGGQGPFSLVTYDDVAAQAEMINEVVSDQRMPPWYAHRRHSYVNQRGLTAAERRTIADWVATGRAPGDAAKAPPPARFSDAKWEIGEPDLVTTALETHELPADGFVDYKYSVLPFVFLHETWISAAEILPSNPRVVHHCNMAYWTVGKSFDQGNFITGRVPGGTAMQLDPGVAFRIPAGSVVGLQIHYTTTGKPERNRMSVGFKFPRQTIEKQLHHQQVTTSRIAIPPQAAAHEVRARRTIPVNASGIGMFSHMHLRGKDMTFIAHRIGAEPEELLSIPNYHYGWQQNYRWKPDTMKFPKGTQIEVIAHFDNSAFNPFNPDPTVTVRNGPQTIHEMMFGFVFYTDDDERLGLEINPKNGAVVSERSREPAAP